MTHLSVPLQSIRPAFQGIIPTPIATASAQGMPNSTYLSIVWFLDDERIAFSNQFLGKTAANLKENPYVMLRVVDPTTMIEYELDAQHLRSESSGEAFDAVRTQLEAVAAQSGMEQTFHLRAIEVLRVDRCIPTASQLTLAESRSDVTELLAKLDIFVRRLSECRDLAEATRVSLQALDYLFGFRRSMILVADGSDERLFAVATNGYEDSGIGAEVMQGEGAIGVAAHRRRQVGVANLDRLSMAGAGEAEVATDSHDITLSGLDDAQSVLATPMLLHDRLIGVLYLDSVEHGAFDSEAAQLVEVLAGHLAVTVAVMESGGAEPLSVSEPSTVAMARSTDVAVAFYEHDGSVLVDGEYVIRGVPGRILCSMLDAYLTSGRTTFTNREIRLDHNIELPVGNDNLEARLLTLRRRLGEGEYPFRVERVGRGRLELTVDAEFLLVCHDENSG